MAMSVRTRAAMPYLVMVAFWSAAAGFLVTQEACGSLTAGQRGAAEDAARFAQRIGCVLAKSELEGAAAEAIARACELPITDVVLRLVGEARDEHRAGVGRALARAGLARADGGR